MKTFTRIVDCKCHNSYMLKNEVWEYNTYYGTMDNFHKGNLNIYIDKCLSLATKILSEHPSITVVRSLKRADLIVIPGCIPKNNTYSFYRDWWKVGDTSVYGMPYGQSPKVEESICEFLGPYYSFSIQSIPNAYWDFIYERLPTYAEKKLCSITKLLEYIVPAQKADFSVIHNYIQSSNPNIRQLGAALLSSINFKQNRFDCIQTFIKFKYTLDKVVKDDREIKLRLLYTYGPYQYFDHATTFMFLDDLTCEQISSTYDDIFDVLTNEYYSDTILRFFFTYNELLLKICISSSDDAYSVRSIDFGPSALSDYLYKYFFKNNRSFDYNLRLRLQTYMAYNNLPDVEKEHCCQDIISKISMNTKMLFPYNKEFYKNITFEIIPKI